eukprot:jgi/Ulvmu1/9033/UM005_0125.1
MIEMPAAPDHCNATFWHTLRSTANDDLSVLMRAADTPDEKSRLIELLAALGAKSAMQMLNCVPCRSATHASLRLKHLTNSASLSFQDIEMLLEDAIVCPDVSHPGDQDEPVTEACASQNGTVPAKTDTSHIGCVGRAIGSSLRAMSRRRSRPTYAARSQPTPAIATGSTPTGPSTDSSSNCSPGGGAAGNSALPHEIYSEHTPPRHRSTSGFSFTNRFGQSDVHPEQRGSRRRALDFGQEPSGFELDARAQPKGADDSRSPRIDAILVRQQPRSGPLPPSRPQPVQPKLPTRSPTVSKQADSSITPTVTRPRGTADANSDALSAQSRLALEQWCWDVASSNPPALEVEPTLTSSPSRGPMPDASHGSPDSSDPHSLDMARRALLRSRSRLHASEARPPPPHRPHRQKLLQLLPALALSKRSQRSLIPSSQEHMSTGHSDISCALQCLGSLLTSTAASMLTNPATVDHADAQSKFDSSELVTARGPPAQSIRVPPMDVA